MIENIYFSMSFFYSDYYPKTKEMHACIHWKNLIFSLWDWGYGFPRFLCILSSFCLSVSVLTHFNLIFIALNKYLLSKETVNKWIDLVVQMKSYHYISIFL